MNLERLLFPALLGLVAMIVLVAPGCGDASGEGDGDDQATSAAYSKLLGELKEAALANKSFEPTRHSQGLDDVQKAVLQSFCEMVWGLEVNGEVDYIPQHAYIFNRITDRAALILTDFDYSEEAEAPYIVPVDAATHKIRKAVDLWSFDKDLNHRYKRACGSLAGPLVEN